MDQIADLAAVRHAAPTARPSPEPPGRAGQAVGALVVGALFMGSTLLTPIYDLYRTAFGFSGLGLSLLYAVYVVGNLVALLFLGRLSDQIGRRPVALAGLGLAALSAVLFLVARQPAWLFAGRMMSGLAIGLGAGAASAWITEATPAARRAGAATLMTTANFLGVAAGPLLAGVLVQYAPAPFRLSFIVYLGLLALTAALAAVTRETMLEPSRVSLKPRLGVPAGIRLAFAAPAISLFASMALVGFYASLGPIMLREQLHVTNRAVSALVVSELFLAAALAIVLTRGLSGRSAMLIGLTLTPIGLGLLVAAQRLGHFPLLLAATAVCGAAAALGYRGGMAVVNGIAPADRKAEVVSSYFVCGFLGNSLPVIGVGVLSQTTGAPTAHLVFAGIVSALALAAFGVAFVRAPSPRPS